MKRVDMRAILADPVQRERLMDSLFRSIKAFPLDGTHVATTITQILRFGRLYTVKLDCGCSRRGLSMDDVKREQLFVGKAVECKHGSGQ